MRVYIVCGYDFFDEFRLLGIYTTLEKAEVRKKSITEYSLELEIRAIEPDKDIDLTRTKAGD